MSATWFVDRVRPGEVEAGPAVLAADVDDVGARRHRVHGLDVECLLAVPALRAAQREVVEVLRQDLAELAGLERRLRVDRVVLLGVLEDRRRGVGVGDRDGHALAGDALGQQRGLAVGALVLLRAVAAHRVRLLLAVGVGLSVAIFWPKYDEHGATPYRAPGGGPGSVFDGVLSMLPWSRPTTPLTADETTRAGVEDASDRVEVFALTVWPL